MFRAIVLAVLVLTCGCQLSSSTTRTAKVAGNVTLDGTPLRLASCSFSRTRQAAPPSRQLSAMDTTQPLFPRVRVWSASRQPRKPAA